jgi:16S rRNA processing protein RimM
MLELKDFMPVGVLTRTHGIGGEIILWSQALETEAIHEMEWVFVEIDGLPVPFFVFHIRDFQEDKMILQFETVTTEAQARELKGCKLFVPARKRAGKRPRDTSFAPLKGYKVWDEKQGELGIADELMEIAGNPLLKIISGNKELLIPAHPDIILEINDAKKLIRIHAPEGLTDL